MLKSIIPSGLFASQLHAVASAVPVSSGARGSRVLRWMTALLLLAFAASVPLLCSPTRVSAAQYHAQVHIGTLLMFFATLFVCRQFMIGRQPVWASLAAICLFNSTISIFWSVTSTHWGALHIGAGQRERLIVWLWFCRNISLPLLITIALLHERRASRSGRSIQNPIRNAVQAGAATPLIWLGWPLLAGFIAFFSFLTLTSWLDGGLVSRYAVSGWAARPLVIGVVLGLDAVACGVLLRHRFPDRLSAFGVGVMALTHTLKMLSIVVLYSYGPAVSVHDAAGAGAALTSLAWFVVNGWGLAGPALLSLALLWAGRLTPLPAPRH